jgi:prophage antirepressor-like protein
MDLNIACVFETDDLIDGFKLDIKGTTDKPLFHANQIAELLELSNISKTIKEFDEEEKVIKTADTSGGPQRILFLTERGLFRLLYASRRLIAHPFQRWVTKVLLDIHLTSQYHSSDQDAARLATLEDENRVLTQQLAAKFDMVAKIEKMARHDALVSAYENIPVVYLVEVSMLPDGRILLKFGETDNAAARLKYLRNEYGANICFVDMFACTAPHKYEQYLKRDPLFVKHKYTESNGRRHDELLAVTPGQYITVKRFMKKHMHMFDDWSVEQKLERLRLQSYNNFLEALPSFAIAIASITDPATRIDAEKALVASMRMSDQKKPVKIKDDDVESNYDIDDVVVDGGEEIVDDSDGDDEMVSSGSGSSSATSAATVAIVATTTIAVSKEPEIAVVEMPEQEPEQHLFPQQPKKKLGRIPKAKVLPEITEDTPLQRYLDECFDLVPDGKTHVAHVRALHRLWRRSHIARIETSEMTEFFKERFQTVQEIEEEQNMKCSFYKGLTMKPWQFVVDPLNVMNFHNDIGSFVEETCELHVMGRVKASDIWPLFIETKKKQDPKYSGTAKEKTRFFSHMKTMFVYYTGVPTKKDGVGAPGFYGLYAKTATEETRQIGYNRSPNTHMSVFKIDTRGIIVDTIESQDAFAHNVANKSSQYVCVEMTKCFANGMKGYFPGDGYCYMRSTDHAIMMAAQK